MKRYQKKDESIIRNVDWFVIIIYLLMVAFGWICIYGASATFDDQLIRTSFDISSRMGSQLIWIGTSLVLGFVILKLDSELYDIFSYYIYIFFIFLLLITIFLAPDIKGSRSWLVITNSIRLQPAEFAKFAVALALAKFMSQYNFKLMTPKNLFIALSIIFIPFILIILQKETGSALVYCAFVLVLYREGLPGITLLLIVTAVILFIFGLKYSDIDLGYSISMGEFVAIVITSIVSVLFLVNYTDDGKIIKRLSIAIIVYYGLSISLFYYQLLPISLGLIGIIGLVALIIYFIICAIQKWNIAFILISLFVFFSMAYVSSIDYVFNDILQPHQQKRILISLGIEEDNLGAGYNVNQSKIAIGSGGLMGKGFLNGTQTKLKYVPEQDTDFIFCTVGEEHGFVGTLAVLILFLTLIIRIIFLAEKQNTFGRVYGYSVASILFFHIFVNVGMVIGITPVIGIPLPFFSYGGSSLWGFTILLFIFLRLDMARKTQKN